MSLASEPGVSVPKKRLRAGARRDTILRAAKELFSEKGLFGVSVDELARSVGTSPAVLYQHFPSKAALYEAVLTECACRREDYVAAILAEPSDFGSVLRRITLVYAASVEQEPDYLRLEMHSVLEGNKASLQFFENRWEPFTSFVEVELRRLVEERVIAPVPEKAASLLFQGAVREALYAKCLDPADRYQGMDLATLINQVLDLFLRAVGYPVSCD